MQSVNELVKDLFGISEDTVLEVGIDTAFGVAPIIGGMYNAVKMKKFDLRIKDNQKQLTVIKDKVEQKANEVFYKQEVFPLIVRHLIEEEEDKKATVIIDGFEHVVDEEIEEMERIYHYYDVLSQLRFSDIIYLYGKYEHQYTESRAKFKVPHFRFRRYEEQEVKEHQEEIQDINFYQLNKFARLSLTTEPEFKEIQTLHSGELTRFGVRFFDFFLDTKTED